MEEEISLRQYLDLIIRRWKWIVAITLVAMITAVIVSFFVIVALYEARAGVVILKSKSEITFEPKYRSLTEEELARAGDDVIGHYIEPPKDGPEGHLQTMSFPQQPSQG